MPKNWIARQWWKDPHAQRALLLGGLWISVVAALVVIREVLLPFAVAVLLAYVMHPAVTWLSGRSLRGRRLPRWGATLTLYGALATALYGIGLVLVPNVAREVSGLGRASAELVRRVDSGVAALPARLTQLFQEYNVPLVLLWSDPGDGDDAASADASRGDGKTLAVDLRRELEGAAKDLSRLAAHALSELAATAQGAVSSLVGFIFKLFLVLMLTAFLLSDAERIRGFALEMVPFERRGAFAGLLERIDHGLSGVVRGQLTICAINGVLTLVGLLLLHVKFAFLLSGVAATLSLIPIFGSIVSSVPIVVVALTDGLEPGVLVLLWIIGIHLLEANFLNPKVMGDSARIHPVIVVLSLLAGEHFYGFTGALFAVPVTSVGITVFKSVLARAQQVQERLARGESSPPPPP